MNINLHIERLIIDEAVLAKGQSAVLRAAVEQALTQQLAEHGLNDSLLTMGAVPSLPARPIVMTGTCNSTTLGGQIAQAVYGGLAPSAGSAHER